ncbi:MAG: HAD family hydrolase, partial [Candidatus Flemingiibacterium sp.]
SITAGLREKLAKAFPELSFAQSSPEGLEINTHSGGKGNAVRILRGLLGGEQVIHTIVCAGNYENDLSMLEYADIGYAVGNAAEQVKAVADRVTVPATENAIARIIGELGEN